jgi:isoquinoline 1-oxidoreductase subunit alpha
MVTLKINGESHTVDASPDMPLLWVLRDLLGMNGTKFGCGVALCGACTVHLDGIPRRSCVMPVSATTGHSITTIEGVGATATGKRVQQAWLDLEVIQCGYCQSGQIMTAAGLLKKTAHPTDADIDEAMHGNICRCGTYQAIRHAVHLAAQYQAAASRNGTVAENTAVHALEGAAE